IARDLAAGIRQRLAVDLAERKLELREPGLFLGLALRGLERLLAGLDLALREIPVLVRAQDEQAPALRRQAQRNDTCGEELRHAGLWANGAPDAPFRTRAARLRSTRRNRPAATCARSSPACRRPR